MNITSFRSGVPSISTRQNTAHGAYSIVRKPGELNSQDSPTDAHQTAVTVVIER